MCGIIGITHHTTQSRRSLESTPYEVYQALTALQHRGQDSAGIASFKKKFSVHKAPGLVSQVFNEKKIQQLSAPTCIGHNRYDTVGTQKKIAIQPIISSASKPLALVHNGNILNYIDLYKTLRSKYPPKKHSDLELLLYLLTQGIKSAPTWENLVQSVKSIFQHCVGGFSVVGILPSGELFGFKDPNGIRPLCLGERGAKNKKDYIFSSETTPLNILNYKLIKELSNGELVLIKKNKTIKEIRIFPTKKPRPCMFEWVYFSGVESSPYNKPVHSVRFRLGQALGRQIKSPTKKQKIKYDMVCPVPDTSRTAAIALSEELNLPYREILIKNRYIQRSFILNNTQLRETAIQKKFNPIVSEIKGKNILLVEDSLVRGNTARHFIALLKNSGAKKITLALTCPLLKHACFYGIDFPETSELIAHKYSPQTVAKKLHIDHLIYLKKTALKKAIGLPSLCTACLDADYPTPLKGIRSFRKSRREKECGNA